MFLQLGAICWELGQWKHDAAVGGARRRAVPAVTSRRVHG